MGTVCAVILTQNGCDVRLWSAFPHAADELRRTRENSRFLPGHRLPDSVEVTGEDGEIFDGADVVISAVPTQFMREVWHRLKPHYAVAAPICSVAKGIENNTLLRPTQIIRDVLDNIPPADLAALSGPSIAPEVARRLPTTVTVASDGREFSLRIQRMMSCSYFRVYTNPDLAGVEIAGATKNVVAIAAGILDGQGAGCNAKAALITRGLAEIIRLGVAMGARRETFYGLAGAGDLVTTCISPVGRNRSFGEAVGKGATPRQALAETESVVEGVATTKSVMALADRHNVEMPITAAVNEVLFENKPPARAMEDLMSRPLKAEA